LNLPGCHIYTTKNKSIDSELWYALSRRLKTLVGLIAHDIQFFNRRFGKGQYFFSDIKKEGVLLYGSGKFELAKARELSMADRKHMAELDFEYWFNSTKDFFDTFNFNLNREKYNLAAFGLHQVSERLFGAILFVFTRYKPSTHNLKKLIKRNASREPEFLKIFSQATETEKHRFELLRKAYVDARYSRSYAITREELDRLAQRVELLQQPTEKRCKQKIAEFES